MMARPAVITPASVREWIDDMDRRLAYVVMAAGVPSGPSPGPKTPAELAVRIEAGERRLRQLAAEIQMLAERSGRRDT